MMAAVVAAGRIDGAGLRAARGRLGLSQAQVAGLLGTSQANVSAYERGRLAPGRVVGERIAALARLGPGSTYGSYQASTLASAAAQLRLDLRDGRSEGDMLRVVIQASDDFARLSDDADRALFLSEPSPTGSSNWDALLAGLAVHLCREAGAAKVPGWTHDLRRMVDFAWWVDTQSPALRMQLVREAVPEMRARGVMLHRRNLESV